MSSGPDTYSPGRTHRSVYGHQTVAVPSPTSVQTNPMVSALDMALLRKAVIDSGVMDEA
jgi:hypothetical protein